MRDLRLISILLLTLITDLSGVIALQCFQCNSPTDNACLYPSQHTPVVDCGNATSCTATATIGGYVVTALVRDCSTDGGTNCFTNTNGATYLVYSYCGSDMCNGQSFDMSSVTSQYPRCAPPPMPGHIICNSCSFSAGQDSTCQSKAQYSSTIYCPINTYTCTISGMWLVSDGTIYSFTRGCTAANTQAYGVTVDSEFTIWICQCSTDYCNSANSGSSPNCNPPPVRQFPFYDYNEEADNAATRPSSVWTILFTIIAQLVVSRAVFIHLLC